VAALSVVPLGGGSSAAAPGSLVVEQGAAPLGQPATPTPQQRVAMLKQWLQASQAQLRSYEWIETSVITRAGEEESRKQNTCYYGVDGKLQKVAVAGASERSGGPPGILPPGRLVKKAGEHRKQEMLEYMDKAAALVHSYVPPDPGRIQQSVNAGKMAANVVEPGRRVRLDFKDYLKSGDVLSVELELPTNRLLGMHVSTYLDAKQDAIDLQVAMGVLPDATIYVARSTLAAAAKDVTVTIDNTGHRRTGG
jgi:hypothetical protein